jgi:hypothetical protein
MWFIEDKKAARYEVKLLILRSSVKPYTHLEVQQSIADMTCACYIITYHLTMCNNFFSLSAPSQPLGDATPILMIPSVPPVEGEDGMCMKQYMAIARDF